MNTFLGKPSRNFPENRLFYFDTQTFPPRFRTYFLVRESSYTVKHIFFIANSLFGHSLLLFANYIIVHSLVAAIT